MSEMPMSGHTWLGAAASFLAMWVVMMVAMMLPSLVATLWRYRQAGLGWLTTLVGVAYFVVWTVFGMAVFPLGIALARAVPIALGVVVLMAGFFQVTAWKAHHLACCREAVRGPVSADAGTAWRHGLRLGLHCAKCNVGLMAILLGLGVMDLRAMAVGTAAITVQRIAPAGGGVPRGPRGRAPGAGVVLIVGAASMG